MSNNQVNDTGNVEHRTLNFERRSSEMPAASDIQRSVPQPWALRELGPYSCACPYTRIAHGLLAMVLLLGVVAGSAQAAAYMAAQSGSFNASNADTWGAGIGVYPSTPGDTASIANYTITATNAGEVAGGVIVTVAGAGRLAVGQGLTSNVNGIVAAGATVNVSTGAILSIQRGTIAPTLNLDGGTVQFAHYTASVGAATVTVLSASTFDQIGGTSGNPAFGAGALVSGTGTLIKTGINTVQLGWAAGSTWNGRWDIGVGEVRFDQNSIKGDIHIAAAGMANHTFNAVYQTGNTIYGTGKIGMYATCFVTLGSTAKLAPGDGPGGGGVGRLQVVSTSGPSVQTTTLRFARNSIFAVDIQGGTSNLHDSVEAYGKTTGQGKFDIASGAKLVINLWTPSANTNIDVAIPSAYTETGAAGLITGNYAEQDITWVAPYGWYGLNVINDTQFLRLRGRFARGGNGTAIMVW
jgi:hypothetical protein